MRFPAAAASAVVAALAGCTDHYPQVVPASEISARGFAAHGFDPPAGVARVMVVRGYVDQANLYGNAEARAILGEWWSGPGPDAASWRFNLKAFAGDDAGQSFAVHVRDDAGRDALLQSLVADARAGRSTSVAVRGAVSTFDAPTDIASRKGLRMMVDSSRDVRLTDSLAD